MMSIKTASTTAGALNLIELFEGDRVEFYTPPVSTTLRFNGRQGSGYRCSKNRYLNGGTIPTDWTLQLSGAKTFPSPKPTSRRSYPVVLPTAFLTDEEGNVWGHAARLLVSWLMMTLTKVLTTSISTMSWLPSIT